MVEADKSDLSWVEQLPFPAMSQLIFIRHGESLYTDSGLDLTDKGVQQIKETQRSLKAYLQKFDQIIVMSSTSPRAIGSTKVFLEEAGMNEKDIRKSYSIRGADIKRRDEFNEYNNKNSTPIYGEMWLTDPIVYKENSFVESRKSVSQRAARFLYHHGRTIDRISRECSLKIAVLIFTHFEIGINYLQGIYPQSKQYPIKESPALQNGEIVIVQLDNPSQDTYTVFARGVKRTVKYNPVGKYFSTSKN